MATGHQNVSLVAAFLLNSKVTEGWSKFVVMTEGSLKSLNPMLLLFNFSGWRDARREKSRKTSTLEMSPATGDTGVKPWFVAAQDTEETAGNNLLGFAHHIHTKFFVHD